MSGEKVGQEATLAKEVNPVPSKAHLAHKASLILPSILLANDILFLSIPKSWQSQ